MSAGGPDLFVVCKSCGREVSPYITECPYCGKRLRKRAPKIERSGGVIEQPRRRPSAPSLPRLRSGEIPGIRPDSRPRVTIALVLLGLLGCLLWRTSLLRLDQVAILGPLGSHGWRVLTSAFVYPSTGLAFVSLGAIGIFGWLVERRSGPLIVLVLFALGAWGGLLATAVAYGQPVALGGSGGALALVVAWSIPDVLDLRAGREIDGDLIGAGVIAAVVAVMPLAVAGVSWLQTAAGVIAGIGIGWLVALRQGAGR